MTPIRRPWTLVTRRLRARKPLPADSTPRERALDALALTRRERLSLRRAADLTRTDPRTVLRHAGVAFRKEGSRWSARPFDRIPREMNVLTDNGPEWMVIRDSRTASLVAEHANAVRLYLRYGDEAPLRQLPRHSFRLDGREVVLETDPVRLDRLAAGGELHYELYRH
jgi:hypothetical protein